MANYERVNWENAPSKETPLNADNLNNMDAGIEAVDEAVANVAARVSSFDDRMDLLDARMDTLVAVPPGSTTSNTELLDIRVGADGNTYSSAGAAVRGQIGDLNNALDVAEDDIDDILAMIAPVFSPGVYNKGDLVRYENDLYECISKTTSGAAWDSTKWSGINLASLIRYLHDYIAKPYASGGTVQLYAKGALCFYDHKLYRALEALSVTSSTPFNDTKWERVLVGSILTELSEDVSDLKADLSKVAGYKSISFTNGKYIKTNLNVGDTVDLTPIAGYATNNYAIVDAQEGDKFTINGTGGNAGRLWCFVDSNNVLLSVSASGAIATNLILTAPANTSKLILNPVTGYGDIYKGVNLISKLYDVDSDLNAEVNAINNDMYVPDIISDSRIKGLANGLITSVNIGETISFSSASNMMHCYIDVNEGEKYYVTSRNGATYGYYVAFTNSADVIVALDMQGNNNLRVVKGIFAVPNGATKMYVASQTASGPSDSNANFQIFKAAANLKTKEKTNNLWDYRNHKY